jgi:ComF family protein
VTLLSYTNTSVHDLIAALKYEKSEHAARICADLLSDWLLETLSDDASFHTRVLLVPVPLFASRERARGYNQIEYALSHLDQSLLRNTAEIRCDLLMRIRDTKTQTALARDERLRNVASAFALRYPESLEGIHVILIDDVTTTGATLLNAAKPLEEAGARVTSVAFAHA